MKKLIFSLLVIALLPSCGPQDRISKETFEQVNESMEVKRLTEAEIMEAAMIWGDSIVTEAQSQLLATLQRQLDENGAVETLEFCNANALAIVGEVGQNNQVEIRRVSNRNRNPKNLPNEEERDILDAYEYAAEMGDKSDPNLQKIAGGEVLLYTRPIVIPSGICLSCHGEPGKDLGEATSQRLKELYPDDRAINHRVGDLRGMWAVRIPKKEVVKRL